MLTTLRNCMKVTIQKHCEYTQVSNYTRWAHRRPVRVLTEEQCENHEKDGREHVDVEMEKVTKDDDIKKTPQIKWRTQSKLEGLSIFQKKSKVKKENVLPKTNSTFDMLQTVIDADGEIIYTKMANNDPRVSVVMTAVKVKNERTRKNLILLEGKRLIKEALQNKCKLKYLLFSRKEDLEEFKSVLPKSGATIYKLPYREMQLWSDLTHSPGVMGIFEHPLLEKVMPLEDSIPLTVICDSVREPGNLGSILRICAGVGCQHVFLTKGCVNLWDTKVTRSSCGAHFRLQIHSKLDWPEIKEKVNAGSRVFMADNNTFSSLTDRVDNTLDKIQQIPFLPYYSVPFSRDDHIVFVIGGETEGLSEDAYNFVHTLNGIRLNIPLGNGVESLNSGVAAGIILFEMRKQLSIAKKGELLSCTG